MDENRMKYLMFRSGTILDHLHNWQHGFSEVPSEEVLTNFQRLEAFLEAQDENNTPDPLTPPGTELG